jgi:hypothetical protein
MFSMQKIIPEYSIRGRQHSPGFTVNDSLLIRSPKTRNEPMRNDL